MTCGTVLHAYSFLTLLSRNKFVDVKRFASKIIMGRPCYCCLHFLITRADQFVDRLASTRDTYEYPEISVVCEGFVGRERGSVQFSSVQSLSPVQLFATTWTAASAQHLEYCNAYWKPKKKSKFTIWNTVSTEYVSFLHHHKAAKILSWTKLRQRLSVH